MVVALGAFDADADWLCRKAEALKRHLAKLAGEKGICTTDTHPAPESAAVDPKLAEVARRIVLRELGDDELLNSLCEKVREAVGGSLPIHDRMALVIEPATGLPPVLIPLDGGIPALAGLPGLVEIEWPGQEEDSNG